jgi:hypothetical protein
MAARSRLSRAPVGGRTVRSPDPLQRIFIRARRVKHMLKLGGRDARAVPPFCTVLGLERCVVITRHIRAICT